MPTPDFSYHGLAWQKSHKARIKTGRPLKAGDPRVFTERAESETGPDQRRGPAGGEPRRQLRRGAGDRSNPSDPVRAAARVRGARRRTGRPAWRWCCLVFPAVAIRPPTRDTARRGADSSLEGRPRRRSWPSRRISPPLCGSAPLCSMGPSSTLPTQLPPRSSASGSGAAGAPTGRPRHHASPKPSLAQIKRFRALKCGGKREFPGLLCAGHGGPRRRRRNNPLNFPAFQDRTGQRRTVRMLPSTAGQRSGAGR